MPNLIKAVDFQLLDHGVQNSQYFTGCGVAFTSYEYCVTGCGDNPKDALEDALECAAQCCMVWNGQETFLDVDDLERRICKEHSWDDISGCPFEPDAHAECSDFDLEHCELNYYVSIRWR